MSGRFITFEGGEGAGKSTVLAAVKKLLVRRCVGHRVTREPGGTPLGEAVRALVLDPSHPATCAEAELLLMFASRAQHVVETIQPALEAGLWVISDRYTDASFAYQGGGRGVPYECIESLEQWAAFGLKPHRTFLLDVPVDEGLRRIFDRGPSDRMERETIEFFERVRAAYLERARREPGRFTVVDATRPLEQVIAEVSATIGAMIDECVF
jgi:dTMP kinase